jgi:crotonobetainyl-CoA:carnitine CoA-transferase CaiB-like acyl-CoA transferase
MSGPLAGLRILDLTRLLPGGFATMLFADLGADVLKVEEPGKGDYIRWMEPFKGGASAGLLALNRGKRSMTLNLKSERGADVLLRLAKDADVLVESFRPGVMDRLGLGYSKLTTQNPGLVYCAITGYGQDGPYAQRAGHDVNYLGFGGVLDIIGTRDGAPAIAGVQIADVGGGGLMAAVGILAALRDRERTGRGRFIDISMLDGAVSWLAMHAAGYFIDGVTPRRGQMRLSGQIACYRVYRCADDKYVTVGALEPQFWAALCKALDVPEFIERQMAPPEEQDAMGERIQEILLTRSRDEWVRELADLDACFGPVNDIAEAFADPHVVARGLRAEVPTGEGPASVVANPIRFLGEERPPLGAAPGFGEHTDEALRSAGYSDQEIRSLRESGVV